MARSLSWGARAWLLALLSLPAVAAPTVHRDGAEWVIGLGPRLMAAQQLAALSGTRLSMTADLASALAGPLRHGWRGTNLADAWRHLLDDGGSWALDCPDAGRCRVWVLHARSPTAAPASATPAALKVAGDLRRPDPPDLFPSN